MEIRMGKPGVGGDGSGGQKVYVGEPDDGPESEAPGRCIVPTASASTPAATFS